MILLQDCDADGDRAIRSPPPASRPLRGATKQKMSDRHSVSTLPSKTDRSQARGRYRASTWSISACGRRCRVARRGSPPVSSGRSIVPARPLTPCRSADRAANDSFDASLKTRNPLWGLRDLETVIVAAGGSTLARVVQMPANNPWVVLQRNSLQTWPMAVRGTAATHDLLSPTTHKQTLQGLPPPSCGHSFNEVSG